jgi:hypothetical protein
MPYTLAVSDFNNDGQRDIVLAYCGTNNVGVFLGYDNGSFATMITYSNGINSALYFVAIADFNNDNQSDIVVTNSNSDRQLNGYCHSML